MKIEIELDVPEGYEAIDYRSPREGEYYLFQGHPIEAMENFITDRLILEKTIPRRRVFECVSEEPIRATRGEWYEDGDRLIKCQTSTAGKYKIWKEVDE